MDYGEWAGSCLCRELRASPCLAHAAADPQVVFPALLPLTYIPALLTRTKQLFLSLFQHYIQTLVDTLSATSGVLTEAAGSALRVLQQRMDDERWAQIFDRCLRNCEGDQVSYTLDPADEQARRPAQTPISLHRQAQLSAASGASTPGVPDTPTDSVTAEEIAKNVEALKSKMKGGRGKGGKGTGQTPSPSPSRKTGAAAKLMRKWGDSQVSAGDMAALDYSTPAPETPNGQGTPIDVEALVSRDAMGQRSKDGQYEVADWDFRGGKRAAVEDLPSEEEILARGTSKLTIDDKEDKEEVAGSSWSGIFSRLTGSKVLSKQDLQPVLAEMEKHLMDKNVAKDISEKMCDAVGAALVGKKLGGLSSESQPRIRCSADFQVSRAKSNPPFLPRSPVPSPPRHLPISSSTFSANVPLPRWHTPTPFPTPTHSPLSASTASASPRISPRSASGSSRTACVSSSPHATRSGQARWSSCGCMCGIWAHCRMSWA